MFSFLKEHTSVDMSGRGRGGRGRGGRGKSASATSGMTTRSVKRTATPDDEFDDPDDRRMRLDDDSDNEVSNIGSDEVTFRIPDTLLEEKINSVIQRIVPDIVTKTVAATAKSMKATASASTGNTLAAEATSPLQAAVSKQVSVVSGNATENAVNITHDPPLDLHLKDEMLAKIIGYKYVKFGELLVKEQRDDEKMTLQLGANSGGQQIMINPYHNQVKIVHINQWDRAFAIYCYALVKAHPEDAIGLILYGNLIKDMAFRGHNWANYDRKFRRLKERDPSKYPWGCTELTLYAENIVARGSNSFQSQTIGPRNQNAQIPFRFRGGGQFDNNFPGQARGGGQFNSNSAGRVPVKKCYAFNKGFCKFENCRYQHICSKCEGQHPASKCKRW